MTAGAFIVLVVCVLFFGVDLLRAGGRGLLEAYRRRLFHRERMEALKTQQRFIHAIVESTGQRSNHELVVPPELVEAWKEVTELTR